MTYRLVAIGLAVLLIIVVYALLSLYRKHRALRARFAPVLNLELETAKAKAALDSALAALTATEAEHAQRKEALNNDYAAAKATYNRLRRELALLEDVSDDISFGIYKPEYSFDSSERYRAELDTVREKQKALIKSDNAVAFGAPWLVNNNRREGERMQKQYAKLMLRAFNGESDAAIARVAWNNVTRMEERIRKARDAISDLGGVMKISLTDAYLDSKLAELRLEYELQEKKHAEAEEQRRIREQMREEERALKEAEKAKAEAEAEEARYEKALEKARSELAEAEGAALDKLNVKIQQMNEALERARELKNKATSMAQLTRSGHVYIISNIGSFGENVFKIGMTRRLVPEDRVRELGDASVPFEFDIHAMVYSTDAPTLEGSLHEYLETRRLNLVNRRKEFFAATIDEIADFAKAKGLSIELTKLAAAKEYRQSQALRHEAAQHANGQRKAEVIPFPAAV
jgi:DNA repair exonuclease SbcCD ATPase subunit